MNADRSFLRDRTFTLFECGWLEGAIEEYWLRCYLVLNFGVARQAGRQIERQFAARTGAKTCPKSQTRVRCLPTMEMDKIGAAS